MLPGIQNILHICIKQLRLEGARVVKFVICQFLYQNKKKNTFHSGICNNGSLRLLQCIHI